MFIVNDHEAWKYALGLVEEQGPNTTYKDATGPGICDVIGYMELKNLITWNQRKRMRDALEQEHKAYRLPKHTAAEDDVYWWDEDDRTSRIAALRHMVNITRPPDVFDDVDGRASRIEESPSYRSAMIDAGRGHLLP